MNNIMSLNQTAIMSPWLFVIRLHFNTFSGFGIYLPSTAILHPPYGGGDATSVFVSGQESCSKQKS
ncbi:MAG: hypothetical protein ACI30O_05355, partial [Muribaculaceae bacterium]